MIVFDLICKQGGHQFEGWFGTSGEFDEQKQGDLITCPICGSIAVEKAVMAPNLGAKGNQSSGAELASKDVDPVNAPMETKAVSNGVEHIAEYKEMIGEIAKAQEKLLEQSEWVGQDFPEQARAIHYGEAEEKQIHGIATPEEAIELEEEGVEVSPLPLPCAPPETQN